LHTIDTEREAMILWTGLQKTFAFIVLRLIDSVTFN